jgi:hypothetical protein
LLPSLGRQPETPQENRERENDKNSLCSILQEHERRKRERRDYKITFL